MGRQWTDLGVGSQPPRSARWSWRGKGQAAHWLWVPGQPSASAVDWWRADTVCCHSWWQGKNLVLGWACRQSFCVYVCVCVCVHVRARARARVYVCLCGGGYGCVYLHACEVERKEGRGLFLCFFLPLSFCSTYTASHSYLSKLIMLFLILVQGILIRM